jgi:LysM repeat protein
MKINELIRPTNENTASAPVAQTVGKGLAKSIGKYAIPGLGVAAGAQDAYDRYKKGDYTGAAISGIGAATSLIPGFGGIVGGLGSTAANAFLDKRRTGSYFPSPEESGVAQGKSSSSSTVASSFPNLPSKVPVAAKQVGGASYKIKPGDTLGKIAAANGTTIQALLSVNPQIKDANVIAVGANLTIPSKGVGGQAAVAESATILAGDEYILALIRALK